MCDIFFIYSFSDGHLGCFSIFQLLGIICSEHKRVDIFSRQ